MMMIKVGRTTWKCGSISGTGKDFPILFCVQTTSEVQPTSYPKDTRDFCDIKAAEALR
jgi:hypothetical protein